MDILYIGRKLKVLDGGAVVSERNKMYLRSISNGNFIEVEVGEKGVFQKVGNILMGKPLGYSKSKLAEIDKILKGRKYKFIFIDHSLLGGFAPILSKYNVPVITFFHNVEYIYYRKKMKIDGFVNSIMVLAARSNERKAIQFSNKIVCLTERDSKELSVLYKRSADLILQTTLVDTFKSESSPLNIGKDYHLFVGSAFFANLDGICWYIDNVLPKLNITLVVVGNGMEILAKKYPNHDRLLVRGFVEDLQPYYQHALFVVNPIHVGSGMKTKTIEALMNGKTIFGTDEAFVGVGMTENIGFICNTASEYVKCINAYNGDRYNSFSRDCFLENFSYEAGYKLLKQFLLN